MKVTVTPRTRKDFEAFKKSIKEIDGAITIALNRIGAEMSRDAAAKAPYDTGNLRRSINFRIQKGSNSVLVGTNVKYARIHDQGGVIKPNKGKYLTIPLKKNIGKIKSHKGFFRKSKAGNLLFFKQTGKKTIEPLYVLKKSITIKKVGGKGYLTPAFNRMTGGRAQQITQQEINNIL